MLDDGDGAGSLCGPALVFSAIVRLLHGEQLLVGEEDALVHIPDLQPNA